jgi:UDP-glucuronate 4-epimerase
MKILITGSAGFIGFHLGNYLASQNNEVVGIDNINDYYDVSLKYARLNESGFSKEQIKDKKLISTIYPNYSFIKMDLNDKTSLQKLFIEEKFDVVCNLAAQAGVRYSLENPEEYLKSNIDAFLNVLECCRHNDIKNLVYASSSSVYGLNESLPFSTSDNVDHPISLYAATKKANELMAHTYSHLFKIPSTGLRFFTVYGPWGRPDMALFKFTKAAINRESIEVYNNGEMFRDFTYIDDIVSGITSVIFNTPKPNKNWSGSNPDPSSSSAPYKIYNIGNNNPVKLTEFIEIIENHLKTKVNKIYKPLQPGDVISTFANINDLYEDYGFQPKTSVKEGVINFLNWYTDFYKKND